MRVAPTAESMNKATLSIGLGFLICTLGGQPSPVWSSRPSGGMVGGAGPLGLPVHPRGSPPRPGLTVSWWRLQGPCSLLKMKLIKIQ